MAQEDMDELIGFVRSHYKNNEQPLFLSWVGSQLDVVRRNLVAEHGSLLKAIRAASGGQLEVINEDVPGALVIVTPERKELVQSKLSSPSKGSEHLFDALPAPIRIAFCLRSEAGQIVAVKLTPPMRYQRFVEGSTLPNGFIPIDGKYRSPGLDLRGANAKEKERLWKEFLSWADQNGVDPELLRKTAPQANALERLLAAQSPEALDKLVLPADIVQILIRHS